MEKKGIEYETPRIEDHGDLAELTAGKNHGTVFDGNFHVGEPLTENIATTP